MKKKLKEGLYIDKTGVLFYVNIFGSKCLAEHYLNKV